MRDGVRCVLSYQLPRGKCFVNKSAWDVKRVSFCFVNKRISWSVLSVERFVIGFQVERKRTLETLRSAPLYRRISLAIRSLGLRPRLRHYAPPWSVNGRGASSRVVGICPILVRWRALNRRPDLALQDRLRSMVERNVVSQSRAKPETAY